MSSHNMVSGVNNVLWVDPDRSSGPTSTGIFKNPGIAFVFSSIAQLDAALLDSGDTQSYLNTLTVNDKVFRVREKMAAGEISSASLLPAPIVEEDDPDDEVEPWGTVWINSDTNAVFQSDGEGNWVALTE